jgi:DNA polymerase-3 subunit gamma/tau
MASSISLYRKYRSQTFDELVGQEPVVKTLKNAIAAGRIGHAYLFTGPRGVGKTSAARLLARAANCLATEGDKPCNQCANCLTAGREIATDLIEIDAASNTGVDNIREVIERAQFAPSVWHTKFYIIDEVHMLSVSAFNALLKTLEEPPPHVAFILATTEVHKVPATVASRCQRFDFRRVPLSAMVERLRWVCEQEGISADDSALELVARQATGSLRDALSLMDQLRVFAEGGITLAEVQDMLGASGSEKVADFVDCLVSGDLPTGLRLIGSVAEDGLDVRQLNRQIVEHLRGLMLVKSGAVQGDTTLIDVTAEIKQRLNDQATRVTIHDLLRWISAFSEADANLRTTSYRQLPLELALVESLTTREAPDRPISNGARDHASAHEAVAQKPPQRTPQEAQSASARPGKSQSEDEAPSLPPPINSELGMVDSKQHAEQVEALTTTPAENSNLEIPVPDVGEVTAMDAASNTEEMEEDQDDTGLDDLERLRKRWPGLVEQINARSKQMAAVFRDQTQVRPYGVSGKLVTISFKYPIHAQRARQDAQRALLEQVLSRTLGRDCLLEAITFDEEGKDPGDGGRRGAPNGPKEKGPKGPAPHETTRGRAAMNIFGIEKFEEQ